MQPTVLPTLLRLCLGALPRPARDLLRHLATCPRCGASSCAEPPAAEPEAGAPEESAYDRVHEPLRVRTLILLGVVHGRLGEEEAARTAFADASRLLPDCLDGEEDATLLRCRAALLEREGRLSEALALLVQTAHALRYLDEDDDLVPPDRLH